MIYLRDDLTFVQTCGACPEQYDVFKGGKQVAYVRLRHSDLTVEMPDCGGDEIIYVKVVSDGETDQGGFHDDAECEMYLKLIARVVNEHLAIA